MLIKQYLYDIQKWEVVYVAEHMKDDKRIGLFDTEDMAQSKISELMNA